MVKEQYTFMLLPLHSNWHPMSSSIKSSCCELLETEKQESGDKAYKQTQHVYISLTNIPFRSTCLVDMCSGTWNSWAVLTWDQIVQMFPPLGSRLGLEPIRLKQCVQVSIGLQMTITPCLVHTGLSTMKNDIPFAITSSPPNNGLQ